METRGLKAMIELERLQRDIGSAYHMESRIRLSKARDTSNTLGYIMGICGTGLSMIPLGRLARLSMHQVALRLLQGTTSFRSFYGRGENGCLPIVLWKGGSQVGRG